MKFLLVAFVSLFLFSCGYPPPPKTGKAFVGNLQATLIQPENPSQPSTQEVTIETEEQYSDATITTEEKNETRERSEQASSQGSSSYKPTQGKTTEEEPPKLKYRKTLQTTKTSLGAAYKDDSKSIVAKMTSLRPIMYIGIALMVLGWPVGAKLGWPINGLIVSGVGLLVLVLSIVLPGNEHLALFLLVFVPIVALVYYKTKASKIE